MRGYPPPSRHENDKSRLIAPCVLSSTLTVFITTTTITKTKKRFKQSITQIFGLAVVPAVAELIYDEAYTYFEHTLNYEKNHTTCAACTVLRLAWYVYGEYHRKAKHTSRSHTMRRSRGCFQMLSQSAHSNAPRWMVLSCVLGWLYVVGVWERRERKRQRESVCCMRLFATLTRARES